MMSGEKHINSIQAALKASFQVPIQSTESSCRNNLKPEDLRELLPKLSADIAELSQRLCRVEATLKSGLSE